MIDTTVDTPDLPPFLQREPSNIIPAISDKQTIVMPNGRRIEAIAAEVRQLHGDVQEGLRRTLPHAIRIGELLIEAKSKMPHGRWLDWVGDHCGFGERDAQRYMRLAKHRTEIEANTTPVSYLGVKAATRAIAKRRTVTTTPRSAAKPSGKRAAPTKAILPSSVFEQPLPPIERNAAGLPLENAIDEIATTAEQIGAIVGLTEEGAANTYKSIILQLPPDHLRRLLMLACKFTLIIGPDESNRPKYCAVAGILPRRS